MANIINLATETKQDEIIDNVVNVKETVNAVNTNVDNVNTNVNANKSTLATVNANLGTPTSGASNATGSNAHAKLNYINSMLGTINNNVNANKHAGIYKFTQGGQFAKQPYLKLSVNGKGVLRYIFGGTYSVTIDGVHIPISVDSTNLPFNNSLQVHDNLEPPKGPGFYCVYDLY